MGISPCNSEFLESLDSVSSTFKIQHLDMCRRKNSTVNYATVLDIIQRGDKPKHGLCKPHMRSGRKQILNGKRYSYSTSQKEPTNKY